MSKFDASELVCIVISRLSSGYIFDTAALEEMIEVAESKENSNSQMDALEQIIKQKFRMKGYKFGTL
jgi:hypothetical protein